MIVDGSRAYLVSDGKPENTTVFMGGHEIRGIAKLEWSLVPGEHAKIVMTFSGPHISVDLAGRVDEDGQQQLPLPPE